MKFCKYCGSLLLVKPTQRKPSQLKKPYHYTAYYYCPSCRKMYLDDKFKIINENYSLFTHYSLEPSEFDVEIWTDGASRNNGAYNAKAAWAFVAGDYEESGLVNGKQTNNVAEASAIYHALVWANSRGYKKIRIHTDSQITIGNMHKELQQIKMNRDIFAKIFKFIDDNNLEVRYNKVQAHADNSNNNRADALANGLAGE